MEFSVWICIGKAGGNYCAYAPEVPGCIAADDTVEATKARMTKALTGHILGMIEDGDSVEGIKGEFPLDDALEAKRNGEEEYYYLVRVLPEGVRSRSSKAKNVTKSAGRRKRLVHA